MNSNCPTTPWTTFFNTISTYDFADEVNLDVLGHLFERSITELEKLKESGLFGDAEKASQYASMPQSAKRKQLGIYYTPPELTGRIVQYTVEELIAERFAAAAVEFGVSEKEARRGMAPDDAEYWRRCLAILRNLKIVDPACGSGAFLFQAYDVLESRYNEVIGHLDQLGEPDAKKLAEQIPTFILRENLYGVDLSPEAVEITQLALWIRSASPGQLLAKLSENIVHGNSLVHDPEVHPAGFDWRERFPDVSLSRESRRVRAGASRVRLRDRQSALGADEVAGARVLLVARPGDRHRHECGQAAAACRQAGIRRSGLVRALSAGIGRGRFAADLLPNERPISADRQGRHQHLRGVRRTGLPTGRPARPRGIARAVGHRVRHDDQGFLRGGRRIEPADPVV